MSTSADKKPLAEVLGEEDHAPAAICIGGSLFEPAEITSLPEARDFARQINAAAEAREAKLQAAIRVLRLAIGDTLGVMAAVGPVERESACWFHMRRALDETDREPLADGEAVSGDVACGLAFDLGVMQGHFHGSWQVMLDALLDAGGEASEMAWLLLDALGPPHPPPGPPLLGPNYVSDLELLQECVRRGLFEQGNLLPGHMYYDSQRPPAPSTLRICVLHHGSSLCGRILERPAHPENILRWVRREDWRQANCERCQQLAAAHHQNTNAPIV